MRLALTVLIFTFAPACAQMMVLPAGVPANIKQALDERGRGSLKCDVQPIKPRLDFQFRFQAGYAVRVPMDQFFGPGHVWAIFARVTPEGGAPVYLGAAAKLPRVPETKAKAEADGVWLVGEGRYSVDWVLTDEKDRNCRAHWTINASLNRTEHNVSLRIPSSTIWPITYPRWSDISSRETDARRLRRITVLLHAAPLYPRRTALRAYDRAMLLGIAGAVLEQVPARAVRFVVFSLDQQAEYVHEDAFDPRELGAVAKRLPGIQFDLVNRSVLEHPTGHLDLLSALVNEELQASEPPDAVIFIGPASRYTNKLRKTELTERPGPEPRFFYLQYRFYFRRGPDFPDSIESAVKALRGRISSFHTPGELATAISQIRAEAEGR